METTSVTIFQKACNTEGKQKTGLLIASFIEQCILEAGEKPLCMCVWMERLAVGVQ